jgi:post-segregation antitoxin (ccd killing protein)
MPPLDLPPREQVLASQPADKASLAEARRAQWLADNREAIAAYNERVETQGLALAQYRRF